MWPRSYTIVDLGALVIGRGSIYSKARGIIVKVRVRAGLTLCSAQQGLAPHCYRAADLATRPERPWSIARGHGHVYWSEWAWCSSSLVLTTSVRACVHHSHLIYLHNSLTLQVSNYVKFLSAVLCIVLVRWGEGVISPTLVGKCFNLRRIRELEY